MRTLVCQPKSDVSTVRLYVDQSALVTGEFEAWTLLTGKQILCVEKRLHKVLERHHLGGTYEQGALYAFEYSEMCAVLREHLGPSDRERYTQLKNVSESVVRRPTWLRPATVSRVLWRTAGVTGFVVYKTVAMIVLFGVVAAILSVIKKHR